MSNKNAKKKLCWSCEGRVTKEAENCPYCGVYLSPNMPDTPSMSGQALSPPYKIPTQSNGKAPAAPYQPHKAQEEAEAAANEEAEKETVQAEANISDLKAVILPLILLLAGSVFFIFGAALYLFSYNGVFTLQWEADYWIYYLILAIPMLAFGWKMLSNVKDNPEESESEK